MVTTFKMNKRCIIKYIKVDVQCTSEKYSNTSSLNLLAVFSTIKEKLSFKKVCALCTKAEERLSTGGLSHLTMFKGRDPKHLRITITDGETWIYSYFSSNLKRLDQLV